MQTRPGHAGDAPAARVDFGRRTLRWRRGGFWLRFDLRTIVVCAAITAATVLVALVTLGSGDYVLSIGEVGSAIFVGDDGFARTVVLEWRMPRVAASIVFGAALGVSGAIFQSLTRNPLASPDIIGFSAGSYTGALIVIILIGGSYLDVAAGALAGGITTAAVVYLLAFKRGVQGFRLIVVGIAISAMLGSLNTWMMLTADLEVAMTAAVWGAGTLNATSWEQAGIGALVIFLLLCATAALARPLRQLELGDDAAKALGVRAEPSRLGLIVVGVALTATVTAAAGPIAFVALAAPQIARRLARTPGVALAPAAFLGAFLLCTADYVAQHRLPAALPVGVVTVVVGGGYLVWLLIHEARRRI
ncbi:FecCD family ABC transporter permease [Phytoactinopolyspora endophytica]|uniref:FecCD family ABC transporter permease n=1 Tax=Phytoactinopolyspora endophytica TaxID=1642495 RepID=UPI00101CF118|nr:iron chelate uptake ABC transporter family permease subunit [Phytoactinopolyspora endophytica]